MIKADPGDKTALGYLALCRDDDGEWQPISGEPAPSSDAAMGPPASRMRLQLLDDLQQHVSSVSDRIELIWHNVKRLGEQPTKSDRIRIRGKGCTIGDDGALVLPASVSDEGPPFHGIAVAADVDQPVDDVLWKVLKLKNQRRPKAVKVMIDAILNQPLEVLAAVAGEESDLRASVVAFMAQTYRRSSSDVPLWEDEAEPEPDDELPGES